jgi:hypothetical protein
MGNYNEIAKEIAKDIIKDQKKKMQQAVEYVAQKTRDDWERTARRVMDAYYADYDPKFYDRTNELRNIIVTIVDLVLGLGIGYAVAASRYFYLSDELSGVNQTYRQRIKSIDLLVKELNITNDKIHSLSLKNGGVVNE